MVLFLQVRTNAWALEGSGVSAPWTGMEALHPLPQSCWLDFAY